MANGTSIQNLKVIVKKQVRETVFNTDFYVIHASYTFFKSGFLEYFFRVDHVCYIRYEVTVFFTSLGLHYRKGNGKEHYNNF